MQKDGSHTVDRMVIVLSNPSELSTVLSWGYGVRPCVLVKKDDALVAKSHSLFIIIIHCSVVQYEPNKKNQVELQNTVAFWPLSIQLHSVRMFRLKGKVMGPSQITG